MRTKLKTHDVKAVRLSVLIGLLTFSFFGSSTPAVGQGSPLFTRPDLINWVNGPARANIGANAEIEVPPGFSFTSGQDAVTVLKIMNNPAPSTLAGIITPASRKYFIVLEYNSVGYVKNAGRQKINSPSVLKFIKENATKENTASTIKSIAWEIEPQFDRQQNTVEWAILATTDTSKTVNHVVRLLGREGALDAIAVQSADATETVPLKQIMSGISFKPGYAYADYQDGDKISERNLAELIAGTSSPELKTASSENLAYAIGGGVLVLAGAGILVVRRKKTGHVQPKARTIGTNGNGSIHDLLQSAAARNGNHVNGTNGNTNLRRRKMRAFDYQRYYTDLMSQVSDRAEIPVVTLNSRPRPKVAAKATEPASTIELHPASVAANLSLIESQKRLIEDQQRLIREQSRLIEEKALLIQEKNQVLEKQFELFGNNLFD
ncbi:MAG TPA: DUF2167 domain-containing protein [Candidatus Paceibacterota bacterium]|nr:DUF2167 domain-containing protein [Candidatus Paceibacterota bacterium]